MPCRTLAAFVRFLVPKGCTQKTVRSLTPWLVHMHSSCNNIRATHLAGSEFDTAAGLRESRCSPAWLCWRAVYAACKVCLRLARPWRLIMACTHQSQHQLCMASMHDWEGCSCLFTSMVKWRTAGP